MNQPNVPIPEELLTEFNNGNSIEVIVSTDWHVRDGSVVRCATDRKIVNARVTRVEQSGESNVKVRLYKC